MAKKEMKYLNEEIVSQLENLSGEISFVFSGGNSGFYVCSADEDGARSLQENNDWFEWGNGDAVFLPAPQNGSTLEIGGVRTKFDFSDWKCQDRKVKWSDGKKMALLWEEGFSEGDWDAWFVIELGEDEKFCKDKLEWKTVSYYNECGKLQKTIAVGAVYDGKEYDFVRMLPNGGYGPGDATWIVPHGYEVPEDNELGVYEMADPATISDSGEYESLDNIKLHYAIFTGDYDVDDAIEEGAEFYNHLANGGSEADYEIEKDDGEDFEIKKGVLKEYKGEGGSVVIPDGVKKIGNEAFWNCKSLTSVVIPEGVKKIGDYAFEGCTSLASVVIPASVTEIGKSAFRNCGFAEDFTLDIAGWSFKNLLAIKDGVVYCTNKNAERIAIPEGVIEITERAFMNCESLASVEIPEGVTTIGEEAFWLCKSLASVVIPEGVTKIGIGAFGGCSSLASVVIPESVTEIGDDAFYDCASLASVVIPKSVTEIGSNAFSGCASLASVEIPEGVIKIGEMAFRRCESLASVVIPESVTKIDAKAFWLCKSLASVVIPASVTEIGAFAFYDCGSLKQVTVPASAKIGNAAFPEGCEVIKK